jgi:uncharacterized protein DUF2829
MNFGDILQAYKNDQDSDYVRPGWNGKGMKLKVQYPDEHSKMTHPYFYMVIPDCEEGERRIPWQPAQVDLFAEDWEKA